MTNQSCYEQLIYNILKARQYFENNLIIFSKYALHTCTIVYICIQINNINGM